MVTMMVLGWVLVGQVCVDGKPECFSINPKAATNLYVCQQRAAFILEQFPQARRQDYPFGDKALRLSVECQAIRAPTNA